MHRPTRLQELNDVIDEIDRSWHWCDDSIKRIRLRILHKDPDEKVSCDTCTSPGCCYQVVYVSLNEGLSIARALRKSGRATPEFIAELRRVGEEMEGLPGEPVPGSAAKDRWFSQEHPCVFLQDGRCSIYEKRPTACRQYFVTTPAEWCMPPASGKVVKSLNMIPIADGMIRNCLGLQAFWDLDDGRIFLATLPRMVATCLEALALPVEEFVPYIAAQPFPTPETLHDWYRGKNPFNKTEKGSE